MAIPTSFYVLAWVFPIYVNVFKRDTMDDHRNTDLNVDQAHTINVKEIELERNASTDHGDMADESAYEMVEKAS